MRLSYAARAESHPQPLARALLQLMDAKRSNLCVSADVTTAHELLSLAERLGPHICMLKTHIDVIEDFDDSLIEALEALSRKHQFMLFEDRKFADIGHTVSLQYGKGIYRIADWAHITNAHVLPGPGIIEGLKQVGLAQQRGLLLLAEMSSRGHLMDTTYQQQAVAMAEQHADFVIGFISQHRQASPHDFLTLSPGISLEASGDALGQQYVSPELAISRGSDVIIVGRSIIKAQDPAAVAQTYQTAGWQAYQKAL